MSKIDLVRQEMMKALKGGESERKNALSLLLSALKAKQIDKRADLTEDEENAVIYKEIKETQETMDTTPADRVQVIEECKLKMRIYSEFAPARMSADEVREIIRNVLIQLDITNPTIQDKGKIMKTLMPLVKGKAEGTLINTLVESLFQ